MKHTTARSAVISGVAALALAALTACGANNADSSPTGSTAPTQKGGTLTILTSATSITLDPANSWALDTTSLGLIDRRLTTWKITPTGEPQVVPDLATTTGTPSDGGRVWTYHLKSGIFFSNGQPITSQDFKYAIERTYNSTLAGGLNYHKSLIAGTAGYNGPFDGKQLSSIETPNSKTIVFHLNEPYGDWPWIVSLTSLAPVPAGHAPAATFGNDPVTSGPYAVKSYTPGNQLVLVRNKYWKQSTDTTRTAGPNEIIFKQSQDPSVEAQTLIADAPSDQDTFGADFVPPAQLAQIENNPTAKSRLVTSGDGAIEYLALNMRSPQLASLKVRQALEYAIDRRALIVADGGPVAADPATTLITPGIPGRVAYNDYPAGASGNPAKAKSLLKAAGVGSLSLTLLTTNDATSVSLAQAVQQAYKKAGINVVIKPVDTDTWTTDVTGPKSTGYDLSLSSWQPDYPSAAGNIEPLYDSNQIGNGGYNVSRYSNPKVDALINEALGSLDAGKAQKLWAQADKAIMADAPVVPLFYTKNSFLYGSGVRNFYIGSFPAYPVYTAVSLKQ